MAGNLPRNKKTELPPPFIVIVAPWFTLALVEHMNESEAKNILLLLLKIILFLLFFSLFLFVTVEQDKACVEITLVKLGLKPKDVAKGFKDVMSTTCCIG